ncbi:MAG: hypothetical protein ETSY1_05035 [Candidatus Entotheonella factor]|uniref:aspartate kinase n=1 Tax=Entotheonella factor TaxID=1429438 RepID=W4LV91_ENTF1|nr:MAG: hypothetical protein ETSY1_05035 [Candidatus Entotheonella factor]
MPVPWLDRSSIDAKLFGEIARANLVVDTIIQNASEGGLTDISFTVPHTEAEQALQFAQQTLADLEAEEATLPTGIAKVSIVGVGMQSHSGVASRMLEALAAENINILMITLRRSRSHTSSRIAQDRHAELALRTLHDTFELGERP